MEMALLRGRRGVIFDDGRMGLGYVVGTEFRDGDREGKFGGGNWVGRC
jgi:hypothetical protein